MSDGAERRAGRKAGGEPVANDAAGGPEEGAAGRVEGFVVELLPSSTFRVETVEGRTVIAHLAPAVQRGFVRLRLRDRVELALSSGDPRRGRIVRVFEND